MKSRLQQISKSHFIRNVAIVATGAAGAQAITIGFTPIIARMYSPETIGVVGTFTAALAVISPLATLSYPNAIVLPKEDHEALALVKLSIGIALVTSLITAIVITLFKEPIIKTADLQQAEPFLLLIPAAMMLSAIFSTASQWIIRRKLYKINAKIAILQATLINIAKVVVGAVAPLASSLVMITIAGNAIHTAMLYTGIKLDSNTTISETKKQENTTTKIKTAAWKYRDFLFYRTPEITLGEASQSLPIILLTSCFGAAAAGHYVLGRMVLSAPSALIGRAVGDVIYPRIAETYNNKETITRLVIRSTSTLFIIGIIPFGTIFMFGPWLFTLVFGNDWLMAGEYARWLSLWLLFMLANPPATKALTVLGAQKIQLILVITTITLRAAALLAGYFAFKNDIIAIALFGAAGAITNIFLIATAIRKCATHDKAITGIQSCPA
ncbi:lipopolysaccharide biosynthesis protein [Geopseudomonas aromaticivorans]